MFYEYVCVVTVTVETIHVGICVFHTYSSFLPFKVVSSHPFSDTYFFSFLSSRSDRALVESQSCSTEDQTEETVVWFLTIHAGYSETYSNARKRVLKRAA